MRRSAVARTNDIAIDITTLSGSFTGRLRAVESAGFFRVLLSSKDLVNHPQGVAQAVNDLKALRLEVVALRGLNDCNASTPEHRRFKAEMARATLDLCNAVQAPLFLAPYHDDFTSEQSQSHQRIEDLRRLALLAIPRNVRIAYEPSSLGSDVLPSTLDVVRQVDMPNLGLSLNLLDVLGQVDMQFSDEPETLRLVYLLRAGDELPIATCNTRGACGGTRVFPGEGLRREGIAECARALDRLGYRGPWAFDVDHPDYACVCAGVAARRGAHSARWLAEDVLRRSVPLPGDVTEGVVAQWYRRTTDPINNP